MAYSKIWTEKDSFPLQKSNSDGYTSSVPLLLDLPQTRSGTRVAGWRKLIKDGSFAASPFSTDRTRVLSRVPGSVTVTRTAGGNTTWQRLFGYEQTPIVPPLLVSTDVENQALSRILEKIRGEINHADSMVAIAEFGSTLRQFGAPGTAITELCNRHLNKIHAEMRGIKGVWRKVKWIEVVGRSYLEWAFGVAPLIEDTRKIAEAAARWNAEKAGDLPRPTRQFLSAKADGKPVVSNVTTPGLVVSPLGYLGYTKVVRQEQKVGCRYQVKLQHSLQAPFGSIDRLNQLLGFDPMRWVPTLYEALPWSWLVDYFLNIGDILDAGFTDTRHVEWIQKTVRKETNYSVSSNLDTKYIQTLSGTKSWSGNLHLGRATVNRTSLVRDLPFDLGVPVLTLSYPTKVSQYANAVSALLARRPTSSGPLWVM